MVYVELRGFLDDNFGARAKDIYEDMTSALDIVDIDTVDKAKRKQAADYILKKYLNFSAQRNRYLYEQLLSIMGIGALFDLKNYRETVRSVKPSENIILASLRVFYLKIRQAFAKYEVILNLFWLKGADAEARGKDKAYVERIIRKALASVHKDVLESCDELVHDLDLKKHMKRKPSSLFRIRLFEDIKYDIDENRPDEEVEMLMEAVADLRKHLEKITANLKNILLSSLEVEFSLKRSGNDDEELIETVKRDILKQWEEVEKKYNEWYEKLEKLSS